MRPKKIILCVAADDDTLALRRFVLETRGYRVIGAIGVQQAIEAFHAQLPALVLADHCLPNIDGEDLVGRLKRAAHFVPMIVWGRSLVHPSTSHADAFLQATGDAAELLARIRILTVRKRGPRPSIVAQALESRTA